MTGMGFWTVVTATALLSSGFVSIAILLTVTRFVIRPANDGRAIIWIVALQLPGKVPSEQFTEPAEALHEPRDVVNPTTATPGGSVSSTVVTGASRVVRFVTTMVYVRLLDTRTGSGASVTVTPRSDEQSPPPSVQSAGKILMVTHWTVPVKPVMKSLTRSRQRPLAFVPSLPLKIENGSCGRYEPTNGANPATMLVGAASSKVVGSAQLLP